MPENYDFIAYARFSGDRAKLLEGLYRKYASKYSHTDIYEKGLFCIDALEQEEIRKERGNDNA